jgi:hypothetical protein
MLRYFLLFGIITVIHCSMGLGLCLAALPDRLPQLNANFGAPVRPSSNTDCSPCSGARTLLDRNCCEGVHGVGSSVPVAGLDNGGAFGLEESSLREPSVRLVFAANVQMFDVPARQGTDSGSVARGGGPVAGPVKQRGPTASSGPQAPEDLVPPTSPPKRLPFQGAGPGTSAPEVTAGSEPHEPGTGVDGARKHLVEPPKEAAEGSRSTKKKPAARQIRRGQETAEGIPPAAGPPPVRRRTSEKASLSNTGSTVPAPPVGSMTAGPLPPLPPALPYTRPSATRPPAPVPAPGSPTVSPGSDGTVMARIPGSAPDTGTGSAQPPLPSASPSGQAAPTPLHAKNPISGFILDSFGEPSRPIPVQAPPLQLQTREQTRPQQPQRAQQPQQGASPGMLGQLGSDVQQLGAGIRGVFDRILPGR